MANIKFTNSVKLSSSSMQGCVDPSNLIANTTNSYTLSADAFVTATMTNAAYNEANATADSVALALSSRQGSILCGFFRSGTKIGISNANGTQNIKVFGLK